MFHKKTLFFIFFILLSLQQFAQDSIKTLNAEEVLLIVKKYHPIVKQAQIGIDKSQANLVAARGAFDPLINVYAARKTFNNTEYYNSVVSEIEIPTWYGIEIYTGLQNINGQKTDPSDTKGPSNYFGVSVPLIKDLIIDKRRAQLKQAKLFKTLAVTEQKVIINNLLIEAMEAYWNWVKSYQTYLVVKNNLTVIEQRVNLIRNSYQLGERAAIDTIEALTQLQSFTYEKNQNWLEFQNAGLELSAFLWNDNDVPMNISERVIPQDNWDDEKIFNNFNLVLNDLLNTANVNHPNILLYNNKLDILNVDKQLKFQSLLPKLDFRYNQLDKGYNVAQTLASGPMFENNFQYGVKFQMPLSFSTGRGEYKIARLKIDETQLDKQLKMNSIQIKIKSYYNEYVNLKEQIRLQSINYSYYQQLVKAEEVRLLNGESSLFILNSRENKALEALEKLIILKTKYYKTLYSLQWSAGIL